MAASITVDLISGRVFLFDCVGGGGTGGTGTTGSTYPTVPLFSLLPPAGSHNDEIYVVINSEGQYVLNRKEAGMYYSNGIIWRRLGDIPSFFLSDNFQVVDSSDNTKGIEFITSGITGNTFRQFTWQDKDGTVALLTDIDGKVDESIFNFYTGTTAPATYLTISDFGVYSANTEVRLINIETGITANTQLIFELSGKTKQYDGIDIEANILALPPSAYTGQLWYATDTNQDYRVFNTSTTNTDEWLGQRIIYDPNTDTYKLPQTVDGQVQNLGQEIFVNTLNNGISGATTLNPKVFITTGAYLPNESFSNAILAKSSDISLGSTYGINTTSAGVGEFFKMATYGDINGVNTSGWSVNTILYVSNTVSGELTDTPPIENPIAVAIVKKQSATDGILFVDTIRQVSEVVNNVPLNFTYNYFTADVVTGATGITGTNYTLLPNDKGSFSAITLTQTVDDNERSGLTSQFLSPIITGVPSRFNAGVYDGQLQVDVSGLFPTANERIYVEVYYADSGGTVIDSGISGLSSGFTYPVRPIITLQSALLSLNPLVTTDVTFSGILLEDFSIEMGRRVVAVISVEKVGTVGGAKTFDVFIGADFNGFIRTPFIPNLGDLGDVNAENAVQNSVIKFNAGTSVWVASLLAVSDIGGLQDALDDKQDNLLPIQLRDISGGTDLNLVPRTSIVWTTVDYSGTSYLFSGGSRIYIQEDGDYEISYILNTEVVTGGRKNIGAVIMKNTNDEITPLSSTAYMRNTNDNGGTNSMSEYNVSLSAGDYVELQGFRMGSSGVANTISNASWIKITKI